MDPSLQDLIDRYVDGTATAAEIRQLDDMLQKDEAARKKLLHAGAMDLQLRRLLTDAEQDSVTTRPIAARTLRPATWWSVAKYAAVILVMGSGWAGTLILATQYQSLCAQRDRLQEAVTKAQREKAESVTRKPRVEAAALDRVIETRGLVLALPEGEGKAIPVSVGGPVPAGRSLWTCPWGGAAMRLADGSSMQLDRNTVVAFSESDGKRAFRIKQGIFFLTRQNAPQEAGIEVLTDQALIDVMDAQVAVAVSEQRTLIEVAEGQVEVAPRPDGPTVPVPAGHYLVVGASEQPRAVVGRLVWRLEPAKRGAYEPAFP
jgi:ferric-dicitrate binding protein FerR (iron transport regulator)